MDIQPDMEAIGVVVSRFQVPELHPGHLNTILYASGHHRMLCIVLGVAERGSTDQNPLSFELRKLMIEATFPGLPLDIIYSPSSPSSYELRSRQLDELMKRQYPGRRIIFYGARDSFVHRYCGEFEKVEVPTLLSFTGSGTDIRKAIVPRNSSDFRAGVIWQANERLPVAYPALDFAIVRREQRKVLLCSKRAEEGKLRFLGVFYNPTQDNSFEDAARRCANKEAPGIQYSHLSLLGSAKLDDWRYKKTKDGVLSVLARADYTGGLGEPGKGVDSLNWTDFDEVTKCLVPSHLPLYELIKNNW